MTPSAPDKKPFHKEEDALARHREALRQQFPIPDLPEKKSTKLPGIALGLVLITALGVWIDPAYQTDRYATDFGKRIEISLPDGSRITLDSHTQVAVSQHLRSRQVDLLHGQALFDVRKSWGRPFRVDAGTFDVKVLGTLFEVRRLDEARVTLLRGSVTVNDATTNEQLVLTPGQQVGTHNGKLGQPLRVDPESAIAWKDQQVAFDNTPLPEAIAVIQQYRPGRIYLDDPQLERHTVSGVFDTRDLEKLVRLLPKILPIELHAESNGDVRIIQAGAKNN